MRIAGANIPDNKKLEVALTYIFGIGSFKAKKVLETAGVPVEKKASELSDEEAGKIRELVEANRIEGDLRRETASNIKRLKEIKAYRGIRHTRNLPSRGQRTSTNSRTTRPYKGRLTMGSGRKKADKK